MSCRDFESSSNNGSIIGLDFGLRNSFAQDDVLMLLESSIVLCSEIYSGFRKGRINNLQKKR